MATDIYKLAREAGQPIDTATPTYTPAQQGRMRSAMPSVGMAAALDKNLSAKGVNTGGMSAGQLVNEQLSRARPDLRRMNPVERAELAKQAVERYQVQKGLGMVVPPKPVSIKSSIGGTLDEQYRVDREYYSPEVRSFMESTKPKVMKAVARLFSGANKQAWATIDDLEAAVNADPDIAELGSFHENLIHQLVRSHISPVMQSQFEANDKNADSFVRWARKMGMTEDPANLTERFNNRDAGIQSYLDAWESDTNAEKWDADPNGKGIVRRQLTPDQQAAQQQKTQAATEAMQRDQRKAQSDEFLRNNPDLASKYMIGPDGELMQRPVDPKPEPTLADRMVEQEQAKREAAKRLGLPEETTPEQVAQTYVRGGEEIPADESGRPVLPGTALYRAMTEEVVVDGSGVRLSGRAAEISLQSGTATQKTVVKPQFKKWGAPDSDLASASAAGLEGGIRDDERRSMIDLARKTLNSQNEPEERKKKARAILERLGESV